MQSDTMNPMFASVSFAPLVWRPDVVDKATALWADETSDIPAINIISANSFLSEVINLCEVNDVLFPSARNMGLYRRIATPTAMNCTAN